ncbi:MAG: hypothetical protein C6P37_04900 [Caldibacillus debilis]|uniref:Uncharacterized protein n=1 Tax=Caldibacillus debilis TaxID=301148 RepID=A0A3E0K6W6_9BACI|nr:MAG: hypothetical protein C6P37_04900 [Caldibacillus debilis]
MGTFQIDIVFAKFWSSPIHGKVHFERIRFKLFWEKDFLDSQQRRLSKRRLLVADILCFPEPFPPNMRETVRKKIQLFSKKEGFHGRQIERKGCSIQKANF